MRSLLAAALAVTAVLSPIAISATPLDVQALGTAPACSFANSNLRYCNRVVNAAGKRGSIGLVGDSVLLGSANGASNPGLPTLLAQQGWSQISLVATLGMRTYTSTNNPGGDYWINRWKASGFQPDVIAVNLGVNHLGTCTTANTTPCENQIRALLAIAFTAMPKDTGVVWWAKIQHRNYPSGQPSAGMLGWNLALDRVAATEPRLVLWNWPANTAGIRLDLGGVHPVSGVEYVKRSTRMAADITARMPAARQGVDVALPAASAATNYEPIDEVVVYDTRPDGVPPLAASGVATVDLSSVAPGATSVALTVTAANADRAGFLRVYACDGPMPTTSSVNYAVGRQASAQVLSKVSASGTVCVLNAQGADASKSVDVVVSVEGWFGPTATNGFSPITPIRAYTAIVNGAAPAPQLRPTDVIVPLPTAPPDATAAAVILTTLAAAGESTTTAHRCGTTPVTNPDVSLLVGDTVAGASYVPITPGVLGDPATLCVHLESTATPPVVIVDVMGWFRPGVGLQFAPTTPTRLADTRNGTGPWRPMIGPQQRPNIVAGVPGARAVSGTLTLVTPLRNNDFTAYNCTGEPPGTSAVNARAGGVAANNVTVGIRLDNRTVCVRSKAFTHLVFDLVGYWMVPV